VTETTAGARLRAKLELARPTVVAHAERIWHSPHLRELYPAYLGMMHMIGRSTVPLMTAALERAHELAPDEVATGLISYLEHHIPEETGHDAWLLEDLAITGADSTKPLRRIPPVSVATLVGAQYYWLRHHHPVSLLGHMAAIEGYPPPLGFARRLQDLTGYPEQAFRSIRRHERLDIRHGRELFAVIDNLPLTRDHETMLGLSALHTMQATIDVLADLKNVAEYPLRQEVT
jgi:hypothetical protein